MNPVTHKEMRSLMRERRGWLVPMIYAAFLAASAAMFLLPQVLSPSPSAAREIGSFLVGVVATLQTLALGIFAPIVGAAAIAGERERGTWTTLLASPVPRRQIVTGKLTAGFVYVLLLLCVSAPLGGLGLLMGACDLPTLLGLYLTHAILGLTLVCIGLAASSLFSRTWTATLVAAGAVVAWSVFDGAVAAALATLLQALSRGEDSAWLHLVFQFNPAYGIFLFFGSGAVEPGGPFPWLVHYTALLTLAAAAVAWTLGRVRHARD